MPNRLVRNEVDSYAFDWLRSPRSTTSSKLPLSSNVPMPIWPAPNVVSLGRHQRLGHVVEIDFHRAVGDAAYHFDVVPAVGPRRALGLVDGDRRAGRVVDDENLAGVRIGLRAEVDVVEIATDSGGPRRCTSRGAVPPLGFVFCTRAVSSKSPTFTSLSQAMLERAAIRRLVLARARDAEHVVALGPLAAGLDLPNRVGRIGIGRLPMIHAVFEIVLEQHRQSSASAASRR